MTSSHLNLPWSWSDCVNPTQCEKIAHVPFNATTANSYPREWLETVTDGWVIDDDTLCSYNDKGELHRRNGPAVEQADGRTGWYQHDKPHRVDGPAIVTSYGDVEWWLDGKRHRENGPALTNPDGTQQWHQYDKPHRVNGPAIITAEGDELWYRNGELHRENGPAVTRFDGDKEWWLNGKRQNLEKTA